MSTVAATRLLQALTQGARAVRIIVSRTQGSAPREVGAWMALIESSEGASTTVGTIGGGHLEFDALKHAQRLLGLTPQERLKASSAPWELRYALGPALGQCCGGVVHLQFELIEGAADQSLQEQLTQEASHANAMPVALFGGGHVGQALATALAPLPVALHWIDSREGIFPDATALGLSQWPHHIRTDHSEPVEAAVREIAPYSRVLIMSFSHAEDLDILIACLIRHRTQGDLPYIGLIGSKSKWASFKHRLEARGFAAEELAHVTCPIGLNTVSGKEPAVIAASVAAQLLATRDLQLSPRAAQERTRKL